MVILGIATFSSEKAAHAASPAVVFLPSLCSGLVLRPAREVKAGFEREKEGSRLYGWPYDRALISKSRVDSWVCPGPGSEVTDVWGRELPFSPGCSWGGAADLECLCPSKFHPGVCGVTGS